MRGDAIVEPMVYVCWYDISNAACVFPRRDEQAMPLYNPTPFFCQAESQYFISLNRTDVSLYNPTLFFVKLNLNILYSLNRTDVYHQT